MGCSRQGGSILGKYVVFQLDQELYGIGIHQVKSIETMKRVTRVPTANPFVKGVINLRGVVIPVIDLRRRLGMPAADDSASTRIIVVSTDASEVGLIVDAAQNVLDIADDVLQPPANGAGELRHVRAMAKLDERVLSLLDLPGVLEVVG